MRTKTLIYRNIGSLTGISRGVGVVSKNPFCWGGMDIFQNYKISKFVIDRINK